MRAAGWHLSHACRHKCGSSVNRAGWECAGCRKANKAESDAPEYVPPPPDDSDVDSYELLQSTAKTLREVHERTRGELLAATGNDYTTLTSRLLAISRALPGVTKELRSWEEMRNTAAENLTAEQKVEMMVGFFRTLAPEKQRAMVQKLQTIATRTNAVA